MKKLALLATAASIGLSGCVSLNEGVTAPAINATVVSNHVANIQTSNTPVTAKSSATVILKFIKIGADTNYADGVNYAGAGLFVSPLDDSASIKSAASYKALKAAKADVLMGSTYITEVNDYILWKDITVTVKGYPGTIKGLTQTR